MPQASEEQRKVWGGEGRATSFLENAGYKLTKGWCWELPSPDHQPTEDELSAASFLQDEWDFGGIAKPNI